MYIYKFIGNNNEVLYIGKASDIKQRFSNHSHLPKECYESIKHIEIVKVKTYDDMDLIERYLISKLNPYYNDKHSNKVISFSIPYIDKLNFKKYNKNILIKNLNFKDEKDKCSDKEKRILNFLEKISFFKEYSLYENYIEYTVSAENWGDIDLYLTENEIEGEAYSEDTKHIKGSEYQVITLKPFINKKIKINKLRNKDTGDYYKPEI